MKPSTYDLMQRLPVVCVWIGRPSAAAGSGVSMPTIRRAQSYLLNALFDLRNVSLSINLLKPVE
jgi:hypothetical protein